MNLTNLNTKLNLQVVAELPSVIEKFNISNPLRLAHFLAQCSHESANFTRFVENLNYSAVGLRNVFSKYFPTEALANQFARQPEKIANKVYANRMGNSSEESGDGFKFRGRGAIQLTGRDNYTQFSNFIGADCVANPDLIATQYAITSAGFFFERNKIWSICDEGNTLEVCQKVTRKVNGGYIGLEDRYAKFKLYNSLV
jgi:putative chitinase